MLLPRPTSIDEDLVTGREALLGLLLLVLSAVILFSLYSAHLPTAG